MSKYTNCRRGFTILETLIAVAVLTVGILAVMSLFPVSLQSAKSAEQSTVAANLIQAQIETLVSDGYGNIAVGVIEAKHRLAGAADSPYYYYQRQTAAEYVDANLSHSDADTGLKLISVIVYWTDPSLKKEKNMEIKTLINKY